MSEKKIQDDGPRNAGTPLHEKERTETYVLNRLAGIEWDMLDADRLISQKPEAAKIAELCKATLEARGVAGTIGFDTVPVNAAEPLGDSYLQLSASEAPKFFRFTMEKELKVHEPIPDWSTKFDPREEAVYQHFLKTALVERDESYRITSGGEKLKLDLCTKHWIDRGKYAEWSESLTPAKIRLYTRILKEHHVKDVGSMNVPEYHDTTTAPQDLAADKPEARALIADKEEIRKFQIDNYGQHNIRLPDVGEERPMSGNLEHWMDHGDDSAALQALVGNLKKDTREGTHEEKRRPHGKNRATGRGLDENSR